MIDFSLSSIPEDPGIYAMYDQAKKVVYVGSSKNLRKRIRQHIIRRDSSVTTGVSATMLNPDKIRHICWWLHSEFLNEDNLKVNEDNLKAAELIAFRVLNPVLRSRDNPRASAKAILEDPIFCKKMEHLFCSKPPDAFYPKTLDNLANLVSELHKRVSELENN